MICPSGISAVFTIKKSTYFGKSYIRFFVPFNDSETNSTNNTLIFFFFSLRDFVLCFSRVLRAKRHKHYWTEEKKCFLPKPKIPSLHHIYFMDCCFFGFLVHFNIHWSEPPTTLLHNKIYIFLYILYILISLHINFVISFQPIAIGARFINSFSEHTRTHWPHTHISSRVYTKIY